ncbi:M50 family metallopeptidase [Salinibacterium hongtaonis]|uniref:M50 family metallopeptidase n=1 Tax=Homoserinimonas hongtaonis TaxID=2079791 RepID=UPI000D39A780|nr:site-2 protease family protein [Salinibacterium hongtaonis]AWB88855.1 peptidase [Salinibacterium hongtaonis]
METVLLYVLGIVVVVVGLAVSIALHELGHLIPAKAFGVRVGQYMIGFGPTLWSRRRGETEYGVKAIPLGGYISMSGMYPPARQGGKARTASTGFFQTLVQDARETSATTVIEEERTFYQLPVWKRIIIMLGGPFMNLLLAIVLFAIVLCGFGVQQVSTTIGTVSECVLPATSERQECSPSDEEAPGAAAGLLPGDTIVSIDGTPIETWEQSSAIIRESPGVPLAMVVERDGTDVEITAIPRLTERYVYDDDNVPVEGSDGELLTEDVGMLGITAAYELTRQPITAVLPTVGENIASVTNVILHLPERIIDVAEAAFGPEERDPNGPISVVGVGRIAGEITSIDTIPVVERASYLIGLLASVNVALMVFNLIPLMPLDGGHVVGALWEGIRRWFAKLFKRPDPGPVDTARLIPLTLVVVIILGGMSALLIYADIVKPVTLL